MFYASGHLAGDPHLKLFRNGDGEGYFHNSAGERAHQHVREAKGVLPVAVKVINPRGPFPDLIAANCRLAEFVAAAGPAAAGCVGETRSCALGGVFSPGSYRPRQAVFASRMTWQAPRACSMKVGELVG